MLSETTTQTTIVAASIATFGAVFAYTSIFFAHRSGGIWLAIGITVLFVALLVGLLLSIAREMDLEPVRSFVFLGGVVSLFVGSASQMWANFFFEAWGESQAMAYVLTVVAIVFWPCLILFVAWVVTALISAVFGGIVEAFATSPGYGAAMLLVTSVAVILLGGLLKGLFGG